jgi:ubiquitin-like protein Pup
MAEQERRQRNKPKGSQRALENLPALADRTQHIDDLLDEIDTVLEENAEEFVRNYIQKGGE